MSSEWLNTTLGEFVRLQRGHDLTASEQQPGPYPVMGSAGPNGSHNVAKAKGPGVVVGRSGASMGRVHYSESDYWPHNTCLYVTDFQGNNSRFAYYVLGSLDLAGYNSGSAQPSLNRNYIYGMPLRIPSRAEQDAIVEILSGLDDRITLLRETNSTLEAIAQALFKSWFVDFDPVRAKAEGRQPEGMPPPTAALFPDSFEESELGLVPKGWAVMQFLEVCDLQGGAQPPASKFIDEPREGYVRLLQIRDFSTDSHITFIPDTGKLKKVTEDDVLIGRYGSASGDKAKDSLGRVCRGLSGSYNVALMKLCPLLVGREFAFQLVSDSSFYQYLQGVSSKAVQSGFSKAELGQYKVVVPTDEILKVYEGFGESVWARVKANRQQAQTLTQLRDTLLPRLISGQLRLPEAETLLEKAL